MTSLQHTEVQIVFHHKCSKTLSQTKLLMLIYQLIGFLFSLVLSAFLRNWIYLPPVFLSFCLYCPAYNSTEVAVEFSVHLFIRRAARLRLLKDSKKHYPVPWDKQERLPFVLSWRFLQSPDLMLGSCTVPHKMTEDQRVTCSHILLNTPFPHYTQARTTIYIPNYF